MIHNMKIPALVVLLLFSFCSFGQDVGPTINDTLVYNEIGSDLPQVRIETIDSTILTNADLDTDTYLFFIAFNPNCGHCIREAKLFNENAELFKDIKVVFVANPDRKSDLPEFIEATHFNEKANFILGVDRNETVKKMKIYGLLPHIIIYNNDHKLLKIFKGDTSIEDLKIYLSN